MTNMISQELQLRRRQACLSVNLTLSHKTYALYTVTQEKKTIKEHQNECLSRDKCVVLRRTLIYKQTTHVFWRVKVATFPIDGKSLKTDLFNDFA